MKIGVIGSGISGGAAAWALSQRHEVTLFEKRNRAGGHSATVEVEYGPRTLAVDTGFVVYNSNNYPLFARMLEHLDVATEQTSMSFSVSIDNGRLEWCGDNLRSIFAQRSNLYSPGFLRMLGDILRFNSAAKRDLDAGALCGLTFGDYISKRGYSHRLRDDYIVPMTAAIWSTPTAKMLDFPAESLVRFLDNHRLIQRRRPMWRTVSGGSRNYVSAMMSRFGGRLALGADVAEISRGPNGARVTDRLGNTATFDAVVIATHCDQSLAMLSDPGEQERSILGSIGYRANKVWLHRDPRLMPRRKEAWAAWNYLGARSTGSNNNISVTYWMNRLQNIDHGFPLFITLNPVVRPRPELTFGVFEYDHPQFDAQAISAQRLLPLIQGKRSTWYCGAWTRFGFHEDGLASGLAVAEELGCIAPWEQGSRQPIDERWPMLVAAE